ncbi:MAG TPA: hypothetical protein DIC60_01165 [Lachnospiraceae bacterium]|nr:hypothetical protein [Lachnospiraceae bacterium]
MKFIKDGVLYVSGDDAIEVFFVGDATHLGIFRKQGMPFELLNSIKPGLQKREKYCYPVEKCRRWFAGEETVR